MTTEKNVRNNFNRDCAKHLTIQFDTKDELLLNLPFADMKAFHKFLKEHCGKETEVVSAWVLKDKHWIKIVEDKKIIEEIP